MATFQTTPTIRPSDAATAAASGTANRILGVDPGSVVTGYGVVDVSAENRTTLVQSGCVRLADTAFPQRLKQIFDELTALIKAHAPMEMAIEQVFVSRNPATAIKLGQARGAAICAGAVSGLPVAEYSAAEIKQAIVGRGRADKAQVQHMVGALLGVRGPMQADAADALAVALTHAHVTATRSRTGLDLRRRRR